MGVGNALHQGHVETWQLQTRNPFHLTDLRPRVLHCSCCSACLTSCWRKDIHQDPALALWQRSRALTANNFWKPHRQPDSCCTLRNTWSCKLQHSTSLLDARFPRNSAAPWRRAWPAVARTSDLSGVRRSIATGNRMCFRDCSFRDSLQLTFWEISQDISCLSSLQCIFPIPKKASII